MIHLAAPIALAVFALVAWRHEARSWRAYEATLSEAEYAARIQAGLAAGVELLGSSPAALATAVARALQATGEVTATR